MNVRAGIIAVLLPLSGGCALFSAPAYMKDTGGKAPGETASTANAAANATPGLDKAAATKPSADPQALQAVLAQVEEAGALDPETHRQLLEDLRKSDPSLWPQIAQVFRASLAYRQQTTKKEHKTDEEGYGETPSRPAVAKKGFPHSRKNREPLVEPVPDIVMTAGSEADDQEDPPVPPRGKTNLLANRKANKPATGIPPGPDQATPVAYHEPREPDRRDWKQQATTATQQLEAELNTAESGKPVEPGKLASLRLMQLATGRRDDAVRPMPGVPPVQQEFWTQQLFGLSTWIDSDRTPDTGRRAAEAANHLRQAQAKLNELAPLTVRNATFCKEVQSFGVYKKFENYEFKPGQELLLYAEVENFQSKLTDKGYHTSLKTSYQVLDSRGTPVESHDFPPTEEHCQNPRRDYFVRYFMNLPKRIFNGQYTLHLTVEDTNGHKLGQTSVEFTIKEK